RTAFMLSGATLRAPATTGVAVFRIVVSNDSMKKATATSHGSNRRLAVWDEKEVSRSGIEARVTYFQGYQPASLSRFDSIEVVVLAFILVLTGNRKTNGREMPPILLGSKGTRFQSGHRIVPNYRFRGRGKQQAAARREYIGDSLYEVLLIFDGKQEDE